MVQTQHKKNKIDTAKPVILLNPTTIKQLAHEMNLACDSYIAKQLSEKELRDIFLYYARNHGEKLFDVYNNLNPTLRQRLGRKRTALTILMLSEFQLSLF